jgi:hypothetical protein
VATHSDSFSVSYVATKRASDPDRLQLAGWLHERDRPIAAIIFTAQVLDLAEAQLGENKRSQRAASRASCPNHSTERCWSTPSFRTLSARPCPFRRSAPRSATAAMRGRSLTFRHASERMCAQRVDHRAEEAFPGWGE